MESSRNGPHRGPRMVARCNLCQNAEKPFARAPTDGDWGEEKIYAACLISFEKGLKKGLKNGLKNTLEQSPSSYAFYLSASTGCTSRRGVCSCRRSATSSGPATGGTVHYADTQSEEVQ